MADIRLQKILKSLKKIQHKEYELYVLTGIVHRLSNPEIKYMFQQYARREGAKRALIDLYLPQFRIAIEVDEAQHNNGYGSTDVGDVMHIVPTLEVNTASSNIAAPGHSWQITACAGMGIGYKGMLYGGEVVAAAALKMIEEPAHIEKAKEEFRKVMNGKTYKCPIPKEVPIPQPQK